MNTRFLRLGLLHALAGVGLGCGEAAPGRLPVYPVTGALSRNGEPAARLIVQFHPTAPKTIGKEAAIGTIATETDDQGRYVLSTYEDSDGAPAGDYVVTVRPGVLEEIEGGDGQPIRPEPGEALSTYTDRSTSPLKATIKPGENRFDYTLQ